MLKGIKIKSIDNQEDENKMLNKKIKRTDNKLEIEQNLSEYEAILDNAFNSILNFDNNSMIENFNKLEQFKNSKKNKLKQIHQHPEEVDHTYDMLLPNNEEPMNEFEEEALSLTNQMKGELIKLQQFSSFEKGLNNIIIEKDVDTQSKQELEGISKNNQKFKPKERHIVLANCNRCFGAKLNEYSIISQSDNVYLGYPFIEGSITNFHIIISTKAHVNSSACLEENVYQEVRNFMKSVVAYNISKDMTTIFLEYSMNAERVGHFEIECIPIKHKLLEDARLYFKKAFMEQDYEWTTNKNIVDTIPHRGNLTKIINENFSYINVDFNAQGGFLHIVEDERRFSQIFLKEILCPILKKGVHEIKYPKKIGIKELIDIVERYKEDFKEFDWTKY
jgi:hypothetical protein